MKKIILSIIGTRPEAIKMAPVISALNKSQDFKSVVCVTGQHKHMVESMLQHFEIIADYDLNVINSSNSLSSLAGAVLVGVEEILVSLKPNLILVQGDTTSAMSAALAAFYQKVPIGHVEAGLRTGQIYSPWPEEGNRRLIGSIASLNFAPTISDKQNLINESVPEDSIFVTGNTVIDAFEHTVDLIKKDKVFQDNMRSKYPFLGSPDGISPDLKKIILVTGHRRESFGEAFVNICNAIRKIAEREDVIVVYPVHLNPNVRKPVFDILGNLDNVKLLDPLDYREFVYFMYCCRFILTDSGGIQEEAPSISKPVLVMRDFTERQESLKLGAMKLVGTAPDVIYKEATNLIDDVNLYKSMCVTENPFGDGKASKRVVEALSIFFK